jgi:CRISPR system Cascade subunit CasA
MDLTKDKWLPVRLVTGEKTKISLAGLLDNAIRDVAWPRADFQGAAWQMLIGILQCSIAPEDEHDWGEIYEEGIEQANWESALSTLSPVLQFGSTRPLFTEFRGAR